ncbi:hypothetical protein C3495_01475 [Clostridiaceae bacterium 14S0207]|nr:hypothetical protein C3495_01475 [Clostridiaceae bacterium 14S0207]
MEINVKNIDWHKVNSNLINILVIVQIIVLLLAACFDISLIGTATSEGINFIILFLWFCMVDRKRKWLKIFLILLVILNSIIFASKFNDSKEFYFKSPNNKNVLIINEGKGFLTGECSFYRRKMFIFKQSLSFSTRFKDDHVRPFKNHDYSINWIDDDSVIIKYEDEKVQVDMNDNEVREIK